MIQKNIQPLDAKTIIVDYSNDRITHRNIQKQWLFKLALQEYLSDQIDEIVLTSNALTLFFKAPIKDLNQIREKIQKWLHLYSEKHQSLTYTKWQIPVCFDQEFTSDLSDYFNGDSSKVAEYITSFLEQELIVHHYGFLPGFCYLSGLPKELQLPRKELPLLKVPSGTLAIGGTYAGIYPQESPGGWHLIGRTPLDMFNPLLATPTFANPGDSFVFESITKKEYLKLIAANKINNIHPKKTLAYAQP